MVLERPLLGYGPDSFVMYYPHIDFTGIYNKLRVWYKSVFEPILIDQPHSIYLQTFFGMGVINDILLCVFLIFWVYLGIKDFLDNNEDLAGMSVILIFIVGSIFDDSFIPMTAVCLCFITFI